MHGLIKIAGAALAIAAGGAAQAAVIDFTTATYTPTLITTPEATLAAGPDTSFFVGDFIPNAVCAFGGSGCNGSMTLTFDFAVEDVMFEYGFGNIGDIATLTIFDPLGAVIGTTDLILDAGTALADLSGFGTIGSILFDNTASTGAGYAYGNISYEVAAAVPLPATLPLLVAGLGVLALRRRRPAA